MKLPAHPADELEAAVFHAGLAGLGFGHCVVALTTRSRILAAGHWIGGIAMIWFHGVSAMRHWLDR